MNEMIKQNYWNILLITLFVSCSFLVQNVSSQNNPERWKLLSERIDGQSTYIEKDFVRLPNGNIRAWIKIYEPYKRSSDTHSSLLLYECDCKQKRMRLIKASFYNYSGALISSLEEGKWDFVIPESVGEARLNAVCKVRLPKSSKLVNKSSTKLIRGKKSKPTSAINGNEATNYGLNFAETLVETSLYSNVDSKKIIRELRKGERLLLVGLKSNAGWYKVIDDKTGEEGWLRANTIKIVSESIQ